MKKTKFSMLFLSLILIQTPIIQASCSPDREHYVDIKAAILMDSTFPSVSLSNRIQELLSINKISYEIIDVLSDEFSPKDEFGNLLYSVIILTSGKAQPDLVDEIRFCVEDGMGLLVLGSSIPLQNEMLGELVGVTPSAEVEVVSNLTLKDSEFLLAYDVGDVIPISFKTLAHEFSKDMLTVATAKTETNVARRIIVENPIFGGRTIFFNIEPPFDYSLNGLLVQSILYCMPLGVCSPRAIGLIHVDDGPRPLYSVDEARWYYWTWYMDFKEFLSTFNLTATFYLIFSYGDNLYDLYVSEAAMDWVADVAVSRHELGLHGGNHASLAFIGSDIQGRFGSRAELEGYTRAMMMSWEGLSRTISRKYGIKLEEPRSYAAPMNIIDQSGYDALAKLTPITFVSTSTEWEYMEVFGKENVTLREFGWEPKTERAIYNIPRVQGGFVSFTTGSIRERTWSVLDLKNRVESGDVYSIFTHPNEITLVRGKAAGVGLDAKYGLVAGSTYEDYLSALTYFGTLVRSSYPQLRWWSTSAAGAHLIAREKLEFEAKYFPGNLTLKIRTMNAPSELLIQVKASLYPKHVMCNGGQIVAVFSESTSEPRVEGNLRLVTVGDNHFLTLSPKPTLPPKALVEPSLTLPIILALASTFIALLVLGICIVRKQ